MVCHTSLEYDGEVAKNSLRGSFTQRSISTYRLSRDSLHGMHRVQLHVLFATAVHFDALIIPEQLDVIAWSSSLMCSLYAQ